MSSAEQMILQAALSQKDAFPKALASFLFREIIEDAHAEYNISQDDMRTMCKQAVNRAALFLSIKDNPDLYRAFAIHAIQGTNWDAAEETDEIKDIRKLWEQLSHNDKD